MSPATLAWFGPQADWDPDRDVGWELYYLPDDSSQPNDLATVTRFAFAGDVQNVQRGMAPRIQGRSYAIEAELNVSEGGAEGVIVANADFIGGFAVWVDPKGMLNHTYSWLGVETYQQTATEPLPAGDITVKMLFEADEPNLGSGGNVTLWANDRQIGEGRLEHTVAIAFLSYSSMDISSREQRPGRRPRRAGQGSLRLHRRRGHAHRGPPRRCRCQEPLGGS